MSHLRRKYQRVGRAAEKIVELLRALPTHEEREDALTAASMMLNDEDDAAPRGGKGGA